MHMKILITTDFYKHNLGGVMTSILALCAGLRTQGHEVRILTLSDHDASYREGDDYFIRSAAAYYAPGMRVSFAFHDPLIKELIDWRPDSIHAQSEATTLTMAMKIRKRCGAPLLMTCHTDYACYVFGKAKDVPVIKALAKVVGAVFYRSADRIVVPSKKALSFPFLSKVKDRLVVIPNGIELKKYCQILYPNEKKELCRTLGIPGNARILICASRLSKEKNIGELISFLPPLLEKVPQALLLIVGEGPERKHLEKQAERLHIKDHVIFAGRIPFEDMWRYYALSDIFVSASVFELHSMSYLEAMAEGLPLLCREDEALDGVLEAGKNGLIYQDRESFLKHAEKLLTDSKFRKQMRAGSAEKAETFSSDDFARSVLSLYETVITTEKVS